MVNKDFQKIIRDIQLADLNEINHKEAEPNILQDTELLKQNKTDKSLKSDFVPEKKEETKTEIKDEAEKEIEKEKEKEEPKNEIKVEKEIQKEETKNESKIEAKEETKDKVKKKKNRHKKHKKEKGKIFEIPKTNPYKDLFDFKEVSNLRFQDNSIFRVINNWEEKEWLQTTPPTKDIDELFPNQMFPQGEIQPYSK